MRIALGAVAAVAAAALAAGASGSAAGPGVDYGVRIVAPVDAAGRVSHKRPTVGVPFRLAVELYTARGAGPASVAYDMFLPTDVTIPLEPARMRDGRRTSRCLRVCTVGWDTSRSLTSPVFYVIVPPKPGAFIVAVHLVSTDRPDPKPGNNSTTLTIPVAAPRLSLGVPELSGTPRAGRVFTASVGVERSGSPVLPTSARCRAVVGDRRLAGRARLARGTVTCSWAVPDGTRGQRLETSIAVAAGPLAVSRTWVYGIGG